MRRHEEGNLEDYPADPRQRDYRSLHVARRHELHVVIETEQKEYLLVIH